MNSCLGEASTQNDGKPTSPITTVLTTVRPSTDKTSDSVTFSGPTPDFPKTSPGSGIDIFGSEVSSK